MKTSRDQFQEIFQVIPTTVAFDPEWRNGTGYYDGIVNAKLGLKPGQMAKCEDVAPNSRRIIIVGTRWGNVAVFERYSPKDSGERSEVYVSNKPSRITRFFSGMLGVGSALTSEGMEMMLGCRYHAELSDPKYGTNIGCRIEDMLGK